MGTLHEPHKRSYPQNTTWKVAVESPHLCMPPRMYPTDENGKNLGPGSEYCCPQRGCRSVWLAHGIRIVNDDENWPRGSIERTTSLGVLFWTAIEWNKETFEMADGTLFGPSYEEGLYDFRSLGDYLVPAAKILLTLKGRDLEDYV